jgi:putative ABC transport system substrate-binding protein
MYYDKQQQFSKQKGFWLAILILIVVSSLFLSGCVGVQADTKVYRVGILSGLDFLVDTVDGFKAEMTKLGYVEGKNIIYDVQTTNFDPAEEQRILEKFVADEVDLIFTFPTEVALTAKAATQGTDIPVLFAHAFIEETGLVESIREPGGNITGVRYPAPDIAVKSLETLLEVAPQAKRVWLPYMKDYPTISSQLEVLRPTAASWGITLVEFPVTSTAEIEAELQAKAQSEDIGIDAIMHIAEPVATWSDAIAVISEFVVEHKLAYHGTGGKCVFILTTDPVQVGKQSASLADKILKGTPAGTIPVVSADPVLTINYAVAQELGLTIPEGLLSQAAEIIR